ncbi:hypothetical protein EW146_g6547 [Bondarzewia mesenterica]|uniref:Uncharacterized protein n=1 Tax=Bondarzewia mesenterica TaxID=1095465 RepID=A0A4V3XEH9_9AGAM|nr:hypothetical protein EW146_g6547 [Bondarzewia mesenterica]
MPYSKYTDIRTPVRITTQKKICMYSINNTRTNSHDRSRQTPLAARLTEPCTLCFPSSISTYAPTCHILHLKTHDQHPLSRTGPIRAAEARTVADGISKLPYMHPHSQDLGTSIRSRISSCDRSQIDLLPPFFLSYSRLSFVLSRISRARVSSHLLAWLMVLRRVPVDPSTFAAPIASFTVHIRTQAHAGSERKRA